MKNDERRSKGPPGAEGQGRRTGVLGVRGQGFGTAGVSPALQAVRDYA